MNNNYRIEGIILSRRNYKEADKILTIFTKQHGQKTILAKGIRKISSKRASHLEIFTHISALIHQSKFLDILTEVISYDVYPNIRKSLERISHVYVALELVQRMTVENQEMPDIFNLLVEYLNKLNDQNTNRADALNTLFNFKRNLLQKLGFIKVNNNYTPLLIDDKIQEIIEHKINSQKLLEKISPIHR